MFDVGEQTVRRAQEACGLPHLKQSLFDSALESPNYCGFERPRRSNHLIPGINRTL